MTMLYNPDLYKAPSLRDMLDYAKSRNPADTYVWTDASNCACAQYSHTKGMKGEGWLCSTDRSEQDRLTWSRLNTVAGSVLDAKPAKPYHKTSGDLAVVLEHMLEKAE